MTFVTATTLPLLITLAEIGQRDGIMLPATAAAMAGAGDLTAQAGAFDTLSLITAHLPDGRGAEYARRGLALPGTSGGDQTVLARAPGPVAGAPTRSCARGLRQPRGRAAASGGPRAVG